MYMGLLQDMRQTLFSAAVLLVLLILVALLGVLSLLLILILLLIHDEFLRNVVVRILRRGSLSQKSGFILGFENEAGHEPCQDGNGDATGGGFQPTGEDA